MGMNQYPWLLPNVDLVVKILAGVVSMLTITAAFNHVRRSKHRKAHQLVLLIANSDDKSAIVEVEHLMYHERLTEYIWGNVTKPRDKIHGSDFDSPTNLVRDVTDVVWRSRSKELEHERGACVRSSLNHVLGLAQMEMNRRLGKEFRATQPDEWIELLLRRTST